MKTDIFVLFGTESFVFILESLDVIHNGELELRSVLRLFEKNSNGHPIRLTLQSLGFRCFYKFYISFCQNIFPVHSISIF